MLNNYYRRDDRRGDRRPGRGERRRSQSRVCPAVRASKSIEGAVAFREQNGRYGVCCWRFVRLEAGSRVRSRGRPHAAAVPRRYIYARRIRPSSLHRRGIHAVLVVSFLRFDCSLLLVVPPDFFFHVPPTLLHLTSSFSARATPGSVPLSLSLSLSCRPAIVPPDFFYGETDRGVIYRACSWLPEPPGDLAFWRLTCRREGRKAHGR